MVLPRPPVVGGGRERGRAGGAWQRRRARGGAVSGTRRAKAPLAGRSRPHSGSAPPTGDSGGWLSSLGPFTWVGGSGGRLPWWDGLSRWQHESGPHEPTQNPGQAVPPACRAGRRARCPAPRPVCAAGLGQLLVWEWQSESYVLKQQGHPNSMVSLAYSPDGQHIVTGGDDGKVGLCRLGRAGQGGRGGAARAGGAAGAPSRPPGWDTVARPRQQLSAWRARVRLAPSGPWGEGGRQTASPGLGAHAGPARGGGSPPGPTTCHAPPTAGQGVEHPQRLLLRHFYGALERGHRRDLHRHRLRHRDLFHGWDRAGL